MCVYVLYCYTDSVHYTPATRPSSHIQLGLSSVIYFILYTYINMTERMRHSKLTEKKGSHVRVTAEDRIGLDRVRRQFNER